MFGASVVMILKCPGRVLSSALAVLVGLLGCESTGSLDPREVGRSSAEKAIVIFTVSHDKSDDNIFRRGANVKFFVYFQDTTRGIALPRAFSNMETPAVVYTTPFQNVWGRVFVREVEPGRYELTRWEAIQDTGAGIRTVSPRAKLSPVAFEVLPGSVKYIGNIHANLIWAKNPFGIDILSGASPSMRNEAARDLPLILAEYPALEGRILVAPLPAGPWRSASPGGESGTDLRWSQPPPAPAPK